MWTIKAHGQRKYESQEVSSIWNQVSDWHKVYFYQIKPEVNLNGPYELRGYSDTDYTRENYNMKSVTGYINQLHDLFVKTEYSAIVEVCYKIIFSVRFYCLWKSSFNNLLLFMLIMLKQYSYQRIQLYLNERST